MVVHLINSMAKGTKDIFLVKRDKFRYDKIIQFGCHENKH